MSTYLFPMAVTALLVVLAVVIVVFKAKMRPLWEGAIVLLCTGCADGATFVKWSASC